MSPPGVLAGAASGPDAPPARVVYLDRDALWSADRDGSRRRPITRGMAVYAYDVTPDGRRVALAAGSWQGDRKRRELVASAIWLVNADGSGLRRLPRASAVLAGRARVGHLRWSPDGRALAFDVIPPASRGAGAGAGALYLVQPPEATPDRLARGPVQDFEWTAEGRLRYRQPAPDGAAAEWIVGPNGGFPARLPPQGPPPGRPAGAVPDGAATGVATPVASTAPPVPPGAVPQPQPELPAASPAPRAPMAPAAVEEHDAFHPAAAGGAARAARRPGPASGSAPAAGPSGAGQGGAAGAGAD